MAWGKSPEEKEKERQQKQQEELNEFMDKYHLNDLDERDLSALRSIAVNLTYAKMVGYKSLTSPVKAPEEIIKIDTLNALFEQNWLIIRQLSRINKNIEELVKTLGEK